MEILNQEMMIGCMGFVLLSSQMILMLPVWGPHCENHCFGLSSQGWIMKKVRNEVGWVVEAGKFDALHEPLGLSKQGVSEPLDRDYGDGIKCCQWQVLGYNLLSGRLRFGCKTKSLEVSCSRNWKAKIYCHWHDVVEYKKMTVTK